MSKYRLAAVIAGGLLATASPAAAKVPATPAALKGKSCAQVPYRDRTQAPHNAAGLIFVPHGDTFRVWDNKRDNYLVDIWFNYAGVNDKWKWVGSPSDGGQGPIVRNVSERFKAICFYVSTRSPKYGDAPIVRYHT
jgi:hypothetical protein